MEGPLFFVLKYKNEQNIKVDFKYIKFIGLFRMANHKSAKKRSIQSKVKNAVNTQYLTKIRSTLNKFNNSLKNSNSEEVIQSLSNVNSILAKAVKKGILKKQYMSRKLSSLSNQIKKN
jgi:small subunit ribosomal protein S20